MKPKLNPRPLKRSEKVLLYGCLVLAFTVVNGFGWSAYRKRTAAAREKVARLEGDRAANTAAAADLAYWGRRVAWLDEHMPSMGDSGEAQSQLLEDLQASAAERKLRLREPTLLKPEGGAHHHELAVTVRAQGPDEAVFRWLAEFQSPEKFQAVKRLVLTPDERRGEPEMECTVTVARWFKK
jgi:hypothetical protein